MRTNTLTTQTKPVIDSKGFFFRVYLSESKLLKADSFVGLLSNIYSGFFDSRVT